MSCGRCQAVSDSSPEDSSHDVADAEEKVKVEEGGGVSQKGVSKFDREHGV